MLTRKWIMIGMSRVQRLIFNIVSISLAFGLAFSLNTAHAQSSYPSSRDQRYSNSNTYSTPEILAAGHRTFGGVSKELAQVVERATQQWGQPNGYIVGQEASGAFVVGLRYGEGQLFTRMAGQRHVFWQGPSLGWDFGGEGSRTMMLVYNLTTPDVIFQRFGGINGSAYFIGGVSMTALTANNVVIVPIKTGVGVRLGVNVGYLNFTPRSTWQPF
jgi:hypothetical protein